MISIIRTFQILFHSIVEVRVSVRKEMFGLMGDAKRHLPHWERVE